MASLLEVRRRPRLWILTGAVVVVLAVAAVPAYLWISRPGAFYGVEEGVGRLQTSTVGTPILVTQTHLPNVPVHLRSVRPEVEKNTAAATFETRLCTLREQRPPDVTDEPLSSLCSSTLAVGGATYRPRTPSGQAKQVLVVVVTTHRPGTVWLAGLHVSYRQGVRFGRDQVGLDVVVQAS